MWEYRNGVCRHRSDDVDGYQLKGMIEKEEGSYVGLKMHTLGKMYRNFM